MILGNVKNVEFDKKIVPDIIAEALEYLNSTNFTVLANGRQFLRSDNKMFAVISEYSTVPKIDKKGESHKKFIDIHFIVTGEEMIGCSLTRTGHTVCQEYDDEGDSVLYSQINNEINVVLLSGDYAIFFPEEIHRPGCNYGKVAAVKKVVIKIDKTLI
jgi:YhcH/YjgK/YiaL family protein